MNRMTTPDCACATDATAIIDGSDLTPAVSAGITSEPHTGYPEVLRERPKKRTDRGCRTGVRCQRPDDELQHLTPTEPPSIARGEARRTPGHQRKPFTTHQHQQR